MKKNNFSPFPFFNSKEEQTKWYAYGRDYVYLCPDKCILPFHIKTDAREFYARGTQISAYPTVKTPYAIDANGNIVPSGGTDAYITLQKSSFNPPAVSILVSGGSSYTTKEGKTAKGCIARRYNDPDVPLSLFGEGEDNYTGIITFDGAEKIDVRFKSSTRIYTTINQTPSIFSFVVCDADTDSELFGVPTSGITIAKDRDGGNAFIFCNGISNITENEGTKRMYLKMLYGSKTFYSAIFTWGSPCMCIEWYDKANLVFRDGQICYANGFKNKMYFDAELGMPSYEFEEEVSERNGYSYPLSQVSYKKYKFNILAPEEVCDVMRLIRLSDVVKIKYGEDLYNATSFLMTPTWQEQGYLANIECEFATDTMVKKNGKGYYINE